MWCRLLICQWFVTLTSCVLGSQDKLIQQQQHDKDAANSHARLSDLDNQAEAAERRILSLKKSLLQNDITIQKLLRMSVGAI